MVVTITTQMVFMDRTRQDYVYGAQSLPYFYDESGARISGVAALEDTEHTTFIHPLYLMDR